MFGAADSIAEIPRLKSKTFAALSLKQTGNIAKAYFRPQVSLELEFDADRLRAATSVFRFALGFAAERYSGGDRAGATSLDAHTIADRHP
jgi:hypothetical protein